MIWYMIWYGKSYYRLLIGNHTLALDFLMTLKYFEGHFSLGCHFHVHFSNPWHAFASHGLPAIAVLLVVVGSEIRVCNATECIIAAQGHFTVNQGRWFWYQSKARTRFPIVTFVVSCIVSETLRLKGRKSPIRTYPTLIQRPRSGWPPSNFGMNVPNDIWTWYLKSRIVGLYHVVKKSWS